jgi:hypothetical protein
MKRKITIAFASLAALLAGCSTTAVHTSTPVAKTGDWGPPHAEQGYVLVRLLSVGIRGGYEMGGESIGAAFVPIEFKYPETGRFFGGSGGGYNSQDPFDVKPVETKIGKPFSIWIFTRNSLATPYQQSIGNVLEGCADEKDPKQLKLNLILSIPTAEAFDWQGEHDYGRWFVESLEIAK